MKLLFVLLFVYIQCSVYPAGENGSRYFYGKGASGLQGWNDQLHSWDQPGIWRVKDGVLIAEAAKTRKNAGIYLIKRKFLNFELKVNIVFYTKSTVVIPFRFQSPSRWYALYINPGKRQKNIHFMAWAKPQFSGYIKSGYAGFNIKPLRSYTVVLRIRNNQFYAKLFETGQPEPEKWTITAQNNRIDKTGYVGLSSQRSGDCLHTAFSDFSVKEL